LCPDAKGGDGVTLRCLKDRNGEPRDVALRFNRKLQRFDTVSASAPKPPPAELQAALAAKWDETPAAADGEGGDDGE